LIVDKIWNLTNVYYVTDDVSVRHLTIHLTKDDDNEDEDHGEGGTASGV